MEHRSLTEILHRLLGKADLLGDLRTGIVEVADWPQGSLMTLLGLEILRAGSNEDGLVCDGCEEQCWIRPELYLRDRQVVLSYFCGARPEMGFLEFAPERLVSYQFDLAGLGRRLAEALGLRGGVQVVESDWIWRLGQGTLAERPTWVYLGWGFQQTGGAARWERLRQGMPTTGALLLVPARTPVRNPSVDPPVQTLAGLLRLEQGELVVDDAALASALTSPLPVPIPAGDNAKYDEVVEHPAAPGTTWNQIKLVLENGDTLRFEVPGQPPRSFTAALLGLTHKRSRERTPTRGWRLLEALCEGHGTIDRWTDLAPSFDAFKVQVSELRKHLQYMLKIEGDPFHRLSKKGGLRARFQASVPADVCPYVGEDRW
jgi:hypothetical protein